MRATPLSIKFAPLKFLKLNLYIKIAKNNILNSILTIRINQILKFLK